MKDKNYAKYAPYLDPNADGLKLKKNAPESAKKAFAEHKEAEDFVEGKGMLSVADIIGQMLKEEKGRTKK